MERGYLSVVMKFLVSSRLLVPSLVLLFNSASSYRETYQIYRTYSTNECTHRSREIVCGESRETIYYYECSTRYHSLSVTAERCHNGWGPEPECNDYNECKGNVCDHKCTNIYGSYICSCNVGYRLASDGRSCLDIDECQERTSMCSQICYNTVASYTCGCNTRYSLASNSRTCTDIDECTTGKSECEHSCSNTIGSYACSCNEKYRLASNERTCDDIDECSAQLDNCTELENFTCENTIGGYQCVCKSGFEPVGPGECRDIDECETLTNNCTLDEGLVCENIIGGYKCHRDSNRTSLAVGVTVGVVAGLILMILAVYFVGRTRQRKRQAEENIEKRTSPEIQYEEVNVPAKRKPNKQEQCSGTTTLCSTPAVHEDLQSEAAEPYSEYQDLGAVEKPKAEVYEAIRKPLKSSDISVQGEVNKDSKEKEV